MKPSVYIDGQAGTTGLQIRERLAARSDIALLTIPEEQRRDTGARDEYLNRADLVFLCLPDEESQLAVSMIRNPKTRIIDASTAHRTLSGWTYGFPELLEWRDLIPTARKVANPGCHATGFLATAAPLTEMNILPIDYPLTVTSLTGYSGGGKDMIAQYEAPGNKTAAPALYATELTHKHLPEMQYIAGLDFPPVFSPAVCGFYKGMATTILLQNHFLAGCPTAENIWEHLSAYYESAKMITVQPFGGKQPRISATALAGSDRLEIIVSGHRGQTQLTAIFDNLGKGASGAAVQNMNLMLGFDECAGLRI